MDTQQIAGSASRLPTGIEGFDRIADGGLPLKGVCVVLGGAGAGKTIFAMQVLAHGARSARDPGILVAFEEGPDQILANTAGFEWGGTSLAGHGVTIIDAQLPKAIEQGGEFDLIGLLAIVEAKAKALGARRIVFDGIDVLLGYLGDAGLVRRELFRLRDWIRESGLCAIVTAKAESSEARAAVDYDGLQFMADCVVTLHHRVSAGLAMRFVRVAKYRGAAHLANEFPMTITAAGLEVASSTSFDLAYPASTERVSTGVERLDVMLLGGFHRGSSILITGVPGTAKTSLAASFAAACAKRGEKTLYVSFDEAPEQIVRNMRSIGLDLAPYVASGVLHMHSIRAHNDNPEMHVARIRGMIRALRPRNLIIDPLSALNTRGSETDAEAAALQVIDLAKHDGITTLNTSLLGSAQPLTEHTPLSISTIADTWMHVTYVSQGGERNRAITIIKSRGTGHSNQVRELVITDHGMTLTDVYSVDGDVLMGTLRWEKENAVERARKEAQHRAKLREQKAELALAEIRARMETLAREQAIQLAELDELRTDSTADAGSRDEDSNERLKRRRADATPTPIRHVVSQRRGE